MNSQQALARGIATLRKQRGWTQAHLAEAADISLQFVAALEQGAKSPSLETLDALCAALRVRASDVFAAGEEPVGKARGPGRELLKVVAALPAEREAEVIDLLHAVGRILGPGTPRRKGASSQRVSTRAK